MKLVLYVILPLIVFGAALIVPLALTGNLNKESIQKLASRSKKPVTLQPDPSRVDFLVRALKERQADLDAREEKVREDEARLKKMESDLEALRTELLAIQKQVQDTLGAEDAAQKERLQVVADDLAKMRPQNAVEVMKDWSEEQQIAVLKLIPGRQRVKILDSMEPKEAATLLEALQAPQL